MLSLVLQLVTGLVGGACLMRLYMQWHRIPLAARAGNPLGPFIFALTNWLVLPLRRVMPSIGRLDTASLVAAYLVVLAKIGLMVWLGTGGGPLHTAARPRHGRAQVRRTRAAHAAAEMAEKKSKRVR